MKSYDNFISHDLPEQDRRRFVLYRGEECSPGCASHLSHPCERCGRYAAGQRNGPDILEARKYIERSAIDNPIINRALRYAMLCSWRWDQTLSFLVIELEKQLARRKLDDANR